MKMTSLLAGMVLLAVGNVAGADGVSFTNLQQAVDLIPNDRLQTSSQCSQFEAKHSVSKEDE